MAEDLRFEIIHQLREQLQNRNIAEIAKEQNVTIQKNGKTNKGWVGQTLDKLTNNQVINLSQPDGLDFELKSVKVEPKNNNWYAKETMAITMFNPQNILEEADFFNSQLWHKLSRMIIVGVYYESKEPPQVYAQKIQPVDISDPTLVNEIQRFWQEIKVIVESGQISQYSSRGTSTGFIQLRTKGSGKSTFICPITGVASKTRAFYATKNLINYVFGNL